MSDIQVQPDWWLASDGKWYPPSAAPAPAAAPPPAPRWPSSAPPSGSGPSPQPWASGWYTPSPMPYAPMVVPVRPTVSPVLAGWLQALFWATGALAALGAVLGLTALPRFDEFWDAPVGSRAENRAYEAWLDADDAFSAAVGFMMLVWLATFVVLLVWMHKSHRATDTLAPGARQWSGGWTIGAWFIPLAQVVLPKLVLNEIERIANAPRAGGYVTPHWRAQSTSALGWLWWIGYVAAIVLIVVGSGMMPSEEVVYSPDDVRAGYVTQSVGLLAAAGACVFGALFVRRLSRRLSPTGIL